MFDQLTLRGATPIKEDMVILVLKRLANEFKEVFAAILNRGTPIAYEELHNQVVDHEAYLKINTIRSIHLEPIPITANLNRYKKSSSQGQNQNFLHPSLNAKELNICF